MKSYLKKLLSIIMVRAIVLGSFPVDTFAAHPSYIPKADKYRPFVKEGDGQWTQLSADSTSVDTADYFYKAESSTQLWLKFSVNASSAGKSIKDSGLFVPDSRSSSNNVYTCRFSTGTTDKLAFTIDDDITYTIRFSIPADLPCTLHVKAEDRAEKTGEGYFLYSRCKGGYSSPVYSCRYCGGDIYADGTPAVFISPEQNPVHRPGADVKYNADFASCVGGYKKDVYECIHCSALVFADGAVAEKSSADAQPVHTAGQTVEHKVDFKVCTGGFTEDVYKCVYCDTLIFKNGTRAVNTTATQLHTLGRLAFEADYTPCIGGYEHNVYYCSVCSNLIFQNLSPAVKTPVQDGVTHNTVNVPRKEPTKEENGFIEHWHCTLCNWNFRDKEATVRLSDDRLIWGVYTQQLTDENISPELKNAYREVQNVARAIAEDILQRFKDDLNITEEDVQGTRFETVLWDVVWKVVDENGNSVVSTDYPEEGIDVILPYPENSGKNSYVFHIYHMYGSGEKVGTIHKVDYEAKENGLRVHFDSLSPVMISYEKSVEQPGENIPQSTPVHQHTWIVQWNVDNTHHWYSCVRCGAKDEYGRHIYSGSYDATCNICGYIRSLETAKPKPTQEPQNTPGPETRVIPTPAPTPEATPTAEPVPPQETNSGIWKIPVVLTIAGFVICIFNILKSKKDD